MLSFFYFNFIDDLKNLTKYNNFADYFTVFLSQQSLKFFLMKMIFVMTKIFIEKLYGGKWLPTLEWNNQSHYITQPWAYLYVNGANCTTYDLATGTYNKSCQPGFISYGGLVRKCSTNQGSRCLNRDLVGAMFWRLDAQWPMCVCLYLCSCFSLY